MSLVQVQQGELSDRKQFVYGFFIIKNTFSLVLEPQKYKKWIETYKNYLDDYVKYIYKKS